MKTAIILVDGAKQIMFTPENRTEEQSLKMISADDDINIVVKQGSFYGHGKNEVFGVVVEKCKGGWYRAWQDDKSVMFVITPKDKKRDNDTKS